MVCLFIFVFVCSSGCSLESGERREATGFFFVDLGLRFGLTPLVLLWAQK